MITRRRLLRVGAATSLSSAFTSVALTPLVMAKTAESGAGALADPEPFGTELSVPPVLTPVSVSGGVDRYVVPVQSGRARILPGALTDVLTFNGSFPGPTIKAWSGRPVSVTYRNLLQDPISVHLHGGSVPAGDDGVPMDTFGPGESRTYTYPNRQPHASLWYHDHAHHSESEHVYRGLSGSYLLTDADELALPLPVGSYDVPIALRDAHFDESGQLVYTMDEIFGRPTLLTNGKPSPYFKVAARKYRFRLLNSSNLRHLRLRLADSSPITQIGSDGGLLPRPYDTDVLWLSPGERADVVIDFSRYPVGTQLVLENTVGPTGDSEEVRPVLRFDVVRKVRDPSSVPAILRTLPAQPEASRERSMELNMSQVSDGSWIATINGKVYDPNRIDINVRQDTAEIWTITNPSELVPHNFHAHLVQFRVIERNGKEPGPGEAGLKDTVRMAPGDTVRIKLHFNSYRGVYVYHCHMVDHSAMGMMAQMKIS